MPPKLGYRQTPEHIAKRAAALFGRKPSEQCLEARNLTRHQKLSNETKAKMSISHMGFSPTIETRVKMSLWQRGEDSPRWIDGRSGLRGPNWRWIRLQILKRDNYTCQACGIIHYQSDRRSLQVHHIIHWDNDNQNNNPLNLVSLCQSCHYYIERNRLCLMLMEI